MMRKWLEIRNEAIKVLNEYSEEQVKFVRDALEDALSVWNIDATDDEQVGMAMRKMEETKLDWAVEGAEEGLFETFEEFTRLYDAAETVREELYFSYI